MPSASPPPAALPPLPTPAAPKSPSPAEWRLLRWGLAGELFIAAVLAWLVFWATEGLEARIAAQAEAREDRRSAEADVRENVRFERQAFMDDARVKPFHGMNLSEAPLAGLDLSCELPEDFDELGHGSTRWGERTDQPDDCAIFRDANLSRADLAFADLTNAALTGADLRDADQTNADLTGAGLRGANLTRANLTGANLRGTNIVGGDLSGADLTGADVSDADLNNVPLRGADLTKASLSDTWLRGADMRDTNLTGANLSDIRYDELTQWPDGVQPPPSSDSTTSCESIPD